MFDFLGDFLDTVQSLFDHASNAADLHDAVADQATTFTDLHSSLPDYGPMTTDAGHQTVSATDITFGGGAGDYVPGYQWSYEDQVYYIAGDNYYHGAGPTYTYEDLRRMGKV
ncbi:MAG TPA: hypothetical protein VL485_31555 [Ktedonobacteraceae bacterium]|jgi:hypothetical protein|nr:hypothetical protein [Ktedonobacteraceae bacterium]